MTRTARTALTTTVIAALVVTVFAADRYRRGSLRTAAQLSSGLDDSASGRAEAKRIIGKVRLLYELPAGSDPTVAAIVDVETLKKKNAFYEKAENGDYLVLTDARAILYRESENKVIEVAPITIAPTASSGQ